MVFFLIRKKGPRFRRREILWGEKPFPSIQANMLLKGFAKTLQGSEWLRTKQHFEKTVEDVLKEEPKIGKFSPPLLKQRYSQWFVGLKRAREAQLAIEHSYLIDFCQFALTEREQDRGVLGSTIEIIQKEIAYVGKEYQKICDAKTFEALFPKRPT